MHVTGPCYQNIVERDNAKVIAYIGRTIWNIFNTHYTDNTIHIIQSIEIKGGLNTISLEHFPEARTIKASFKSLQINVFRIAFYFLYVP